MTGETADRQGAHWRFCICPLVTTSMPDAQALPSFVPHTQGPKTTLEADHRPSHPHLVRIGANAPQHEGRLSPLSICLVIPVVVESG